MRKFYVLDTSVLAYDPLAFREFRDNDVVIPITVLDELDKLKTFSNSAGKNARIFIRLFDELLNNQDVTKPIKLLEQNINLRIDARQHDITMGDDKNYGDNKILACAKAHVRVMKKTGLPREVVLVTRDINLRIRARTMGLGAEHYEKDRLGRHDLYTGMQTIEHLDDGVTLNETGMLNLEGKSYDIYPNECVNFVDESGGGLAIGRRIGDRLRVIQGQSPFGLQAKNREQAYAINMLLDPKLPLVSLIGKAGSGKSLVALACGLENVIERRKFDKMVIFRPMQAVGGDVGFLPGTLEEKIGPWMGAIRDSLELLLRPRTNQKERWDALLGQYMEKGKVEFNPLTYIRGRSISNAFILVDEAQNISKEDMKAILTRAGHGTKIVLTGDIEQIDATHLDALNNGLTYAVEKFKTSELSGHVTFLKGERSPLATEASELL